MTVRRQFVTPRGSRFDSAHEISNGLRAIASYLNRPHTVAAHLKSIADETDLRAAICSRCRQSFVDCHCLETVLEGYTTAFAGVSDAERDDIERSMDSGLDESTVGRLYADFCHATTPDEKESRRARLLEYCATAEWTER